MGKGTLTVVNMFPSLINKGSMPTPLNALAAMAALGSQSLQLIALQYTCFPYAAKLRALLCISAELESSVVVESLFYMNFSFAHSC